MILEFSLVFALYESGIVNFMDILRAYKVSRFGFLSELPSKVTINYKNFDRCKVRDAKVLAAASAFLVLRTKTNFNSKCWRKGLDPRALHLCKHTP